MLLMLTINILTIRLAPNSTRRAMCMLAAVLLPPIMIETECLEDFRVTVITPTPVWVSVVKNPVETLCKACTLLFIIETTVSCLAIVSGLSKFLPSLRQNLLRTVCLVCI